MVRTQARAFGTTAASLEQSNMKPRELIDFMNSNPEKWEDKEWREAYLAAVETALEDGQGPIPLNSHDDNKCVCRSRRAVAQPAAGGLL